MAELVLRQSPDGVWFADPVDGGDRADNVAGWNGIQGLLSHSAVLWESPTALSRFRAQFGEPPVDLDAAAMSIAPQT